MGLLQLLWCDGDDCSYFTNLRFLSLLVLIAWLRPFTNLLESESFSNKSSSISKLISSEVRKCSLLCQLKFLMVSVP